MNQTLRMDVRSAAAGAYKAVYGEFGWAFPQLSARELTKTLWTATEGHGDLTEDDMKAVHDQVVPWLEEIVELLKAEITKREQEKGGGAC